MSTLTTNFQYHESPKYALTVRKDQKQLSPDSIRTLLDVSPEMQQINVLLDEKCYSLHEDEKLNYFSKIYTEVIEINKDLFSSKTTPEKAGILFRLHSDTIVQQVSHSDKTTTLIESFFKGLQDPYKTPEVKRIVSIEAQRKLRERISCLHSGYVRFAVAAALEVPIASIPSLSCSENDLEEIHRLKIPSNIDIYKE